MKKRNQLWYGGDYNPEQWLQEPEILVKDIKLMKEANINIVTLGIFAWTTLEPDEGDYHFAWLEEIINRLYSHGILTILATPSGARPKWISDRYPEVLRVGENRTRNLFGGRHNHCYTSPVYREKVRTINGKLACRFADNPAIVMWHISNEFGGECHCSLCQMAFREWLRNRYTSIGQINETWYTKFWSHDYQSFEQIESPSSIGENALHGLTLDWKRFVTDQTADFMKQEIDALRISGAKQPVTTNFMYDFKGLNYGKLAPYLDVVSWDSYPLWHKKTDSAIAWDTAMQHDYMRSLKHQPFLLMESCPGSTNWQGVSKLKKPMMLEAASLQAIAHGSDSVQYFQIRQSRGSSEKFHGALIDHYGEHDTRVFHEAAKLGEALSGLHELSESQVKAPAAVIYDTESRWALEGAQGPRNDGLYYHETVLKSYEALKKYGLDVDVIDMEQSLNEYRVVAAPMLYMFRSGIEDKIRAFVENGGILFLTYWSGIVDSTDLCFLGGTPHKLIDVMGLRSEEIDGLYEEETNCALPVEENDLGIETSYSCKYLCSLVKLNTAVPLMVYGDDFYAGTPVLTCNDFGEGNAYYVGADMEQDFYDTIYASALQKAGIQRLLPHLSEDVLVSSRENEKTTYIFVQNYGKEKKGVPIPEGGSVILGSAVGNLHQYETMIIKKEK